MPSVAKTIELSAESPDSFEDAIRVGIAKAGETLHNIEGAYVKEQKAVVTDGQITGFRVHMQVTFVLD
ncbi:MAG TPA: dodecin family protein [Acidimicrobiales bacterium]|jgi:flavin-binding protein dodecin|nr:dodecin family protein [Acidimicrobiales bacterium]